MAGQTFASRLEQIDLESPLIDRFRIEEGLREHLTRLEATPARIKVPPSRLRSPDHVGGGGVEDAQHAWSEVAGRVCTGVCIPRGCATGQAHLSRL